MKPLLLSFVGPSGVGKSTAFRFARNWLHDHDYIVVRSDVAFPLRRIQRDAYLALGKLDPGNPEEPTLFVQDGELLQFLAQRFEAELVREASEAVRKVLGVRWWKPLAVINTDCRDNAYPVFQNYGFTFVRLTVDNDELSRRLNGRGDQSLADPLHPTEQTGTIPSAFVIDNSGSLDQLRKQVERVVAQVAATPS